MSEYFQDIFSADGKNIGVFYVTPMDIKDLIKGKLYTIRLILAFFLTTAFLMQWLITGNVYIWALFPINILLLPQLYIAISLTSYRYIDLDAAIINTNRTKSGTKLYIIASIILLGEFLFYYLLSTNNISLSLYLLSLLSALIVILAIEKPLINYFARRYPSWLKKFILKKEISFDF